MEGEGSQSYGATYFSLLPPPINKMTQVLQTRKIYEIDKPLQMVKMAVILKKHIIANNLYVPIVGKNYVMVEGWQFAGGMMGLFPRITKVENLAPGKWMAQAEIVNKRDEKIVGSGFAICSKEEMKKKTFDEYAILSMAQTRAIGKAYRNLIGWVMKMAGYESTPAEEIKRDKTGKPKEGNNGNGVEALMASESDIERIKKVAKEMGLNTIRQVEKKIGISINLKAMTKTQAARIYAELLAKQVAKK